MHFSKLILIPAVATIAVVVSAASVVAHGYDGNMVNMAAQSYGGNWPVTVTRSQHSNGTDCLTLAADGSASLVIGGQRFPNGSFLVTNHTLVATITAQAYSQNAGLVFIGSADRGKIGPGVFEDVYGGSDFDSGALAFGMKGGC
jgi:hypothetical protein